MTALLSMIWRSILLFGGRLFSWGAALSPGKIAWGGAVIGALGAVLWIGTLRAANADLERETARLENALAQSAAVGEAQLRALDAMAHAAAVDARLADFLHDAAEEALNAPETDNGAVAPVLGRAFERLRDEPAGSLVDGDPVDAP